MHPTTPKTKRGFASMDPAKQRKLASKGGSSVPKHKRSFSQDRSLAASAGRTGGLATQERKQDQSK